MPSSQPSEASTIPSLRVLAVGHCYSDPLPRQKWYALKDLAPECDIKIVTPRVWPDALKVLRSQAVREDRIEFIPLRTVGAGYGSRYFYIDWRLVSLIRSFQPHIVHVDHEPWSIAYTQLRLMVQLLSPQARMVVFTWWNVRRRLPPIWSSVYRANVRRTALLIAGNHAGEGVHRALSYDGPVEVIPQLGVDLVTHFPGPPDTSRRQSLARGRTFVVGFVGRLIAGKDVGLLMQALSHLSDESWQLAIVGDGPDRADLEQQALRLGIAERVSFVGAVQQTDVAEWIRCFDLLVLPSTNELNEQFGHVLVEAMACGVPVAGSTSGEVPHVIGDAGIVFPARDPEQLSRHLREVIANRGYLQTLAERGRERTLHRFTDAAIAQQTLNAYRQHVTIPTPRQA